MGTSPFHRILTVREQEIAGYIARGWRTREIATALCVSIRTVENHLYAIYGKLGIGSRVHLALLARAPDNERSALAPSDAA